MCSYFLAVGTVIGLFTFRSIPLCGLVLLYTTDVCLLFFPGLFLYLLASNQFQDSRCPSRRLQERKEVKIVIIIFLSLGSMSDLSKPCLHSGSTTLPHCNSNYRGDSRIQLLSTSGCFTITHLICYVFHHFCHVLFIKLPVMSSLSS